MPYPIIRQDKTGRGEQWQIDIQADFVTLIAPDGRVLLRWQPVEVAGAVEFPSFSKSLKYTAFSVPGWGIFQFNMHPKVVKMLRTFSLRGFAAMGSAGLSKLLTKAIISLALGCLATAVGIWMLGVTINNLRGGQVNPNGGRPGTGVVSTVTGLALVSRGIYQLYHYFQVKKIGR